VKDLVNSDPSLLDCSAKEEIDLEIKNKIIDNTGKELELKTIMNSLSILSFLKYSALVCVKKEIEDKKNSEPGVGPDLNDVD
jgi:hypothetical protein